MNPDVVSWLTWGLQALIGFACWLIWTKLDKNTEAIHKIEVLLPTAYTTKVDFDGFRDYHGEKTSDLEEKVRRLELKDASRSKFKNFND